MNDRFLRACRREPTDVTPVWFMRQAGRYMAEYRKVREKHSLLEICKTPELSLEVTLQPLRLGVDAAILFADILLPLEPMGAPFEFAKGEGPVIHEPIRDARGIDNLRVIDPAEEGLGYVLSAVRLIRKELGDRVPLIGFAGGPFTLASYLVEGGRSTHFEKTKRLMYGDPAAWDELMGKLAEVVRRFLVAQIEAGAQAVQLFDSWVGSLSVDDYRQFVMPHVSRILGDPGVRSVPAIHFGTDTGALLGLMREAGGTVIGIDWRTPLDEAWDKVGGGVALQGNLDPTVLFAPWDFIAQATGRVLSRARGRAGHIFNLGHGILPETPIDSVARLVDFVHESTARA
jgi:uroporphyrinogen decarboxylase